MSKKKNVQVAIAESSACGCPQPAPYPLSMGEPTIAIAERSGSVLGPNVIRFERATTEGDDAPSFTLLKEVPLPTQACEAGACLPWVRVTRDPTNFRKCLESARKMGQISSSKKFYDLIKEHLEAEDQETFYVVCLDTQLYVRSISDITRGARDRVQVPVPDVLRLAIVEGATAMLVAHNHPSGKVDPSDADKSLTEALVEAAEIVGIPLFDHIIVASGNGYYSFADHKLI